MVWRRYASSAARELDAAIDELQHGVARAVPSALVSLMKQCGPSTIAQARSLHACLNSHGYQQDTFLQNMVVQMYGRCGSVAEACEVFAKISQPNTFSWNILIAAYAQNGHLERAAELFKAMPYRDVVSWNSMIAAHGKTMEAFCLFHWMCQEGARPNSITLGNLLDVSANIVHLKGGVFLHKVAAECGLETSIIVGTSLVHMYGKCGRTADAQAAFDCMSTKNVVVWTVLVAAYAQNGQLEKARGIFGHKVPQRTVVTWNVMINAYARDGQAQKALDLYWEMRTAGVPADKVTFIGAVDACTSLGVLAESRNVHSEILTSSLVLDNQLKASLINMYSMCRDVKAANKVFGEGIGADASVWTAMVAAYAREGSIAKATRLLHHEQAPALDLVSCNILITAFGVGCSVSEAEQVFSTMKIRDHVSWNALIAAYVENGHPASALTALTRMDLEGLRPNSITYVHVLEACSRFAALKQAGELVYDEIRASSIFNSDVLVQTALVNMFGKQGALERARKHFDAMGLRNKVTWNSMITSYAQAGRGREALQVFATMDLEAVEPSKVTFISILDACADLGFLHAGKEILSNLHLEFCKQEPVLATAVVNMYAKCAMLNEAKAIFDTSVDRDSVSWSALVAAYAHNGEHKQAVDMFHLMNLEGILPTETSLVVVISACSHAGLHRIGLGHFQSISVDYGLKLTGNHCSCLVDLLGRSGRLAEARELVENIPAELRSVEQTTLLAACQMHGSSSQVGSHLVPAAAVEYVLLSNIYSSS